MNKLTILAATAALSGCVVHSAPRREPAPQAPPRGPVHRAEPVQPGRVVHPRLALDAPAAASIARDYAYRRGLTAEARKVGREADSWRVELKAHGDYKGRLLVLVDAYTAQVSVLEDGIRPHDRGRGNGRDDDEHDRDDDRGGHHGGHHGRGHD